MTYAELKDALSVFGFSEHDHPTLAHVKQRHRTLLKAHHPDLAPQAHLATIERINAAAALVLTYLKDYRFSFSEDEFYRQTPDERLRMQFSNDPVWGGGP